MHHPTDRIAHTTAFVIQEIAQCYVIRQYIIYKFSKKLSFSYIGQDKSKLQKQTSKLLILIATASVTKMTLKAQSFHHVSTLCK